MVSGVDIALENRGRDRCLTCHAFGRSRLSTDLRRRGSGDGGTPRPAIHGRIPFMAPSERLEQITNHLSNNYARGLLNGDVAIITGIPFQF